jgi:hypothetical protein
MGDLQHLHGLKCKMTKNIVFPEVIVQRESFWTGSTTYGPGGTDKRHDSTSLVVGREEEEVAARQQQSSSGGRIRHENENLWGRAQKRGERGW